MSTDNERKKAVRDLLNGVRDIFSRWDSSGALSSVEGKESARLDEECVAKIATMILKNASVPEVAAYLDRLVSKTVGVSSDAGRNKAFAEQFIAAGKGQRK